jgi:hypothetical protein
MLISNTVWLSMDHSASRMTTKVKRVIWSCPQSGRLWFEGRRLNDIAADSDCRFLRQIARESEAR